MLRKVSQMKRSFIAVWLLLLVGCGTAPRVVRLDTGEMHPLAFEPRSHAQPVRLEPDEFKAAVAVRAREVRLPARIQDAARRLFEMDARTGSFEYNGRTRRLSAALQPGDALEEEPTRIEAELTSDYLRWCERTGRPGDCLHLLEEGSTLNGDGRYTLAMALAKGVVLDEMLEAFKDMADPHAMVSAVLWTCTTYMLLLTVPEPVSKGIAAVMTATIIAYVGVDTFWGLIVGFKRLVLEADRATTFHELREAGERYGKGMGRNAARAFAMLATVAIGNTAAGFAAKGPGLPGYAAASVMAETQAGFRLGAVAEVQSVALPATGSMTIVLAPSAVAATVMGSGNGSPGTVSTPAGSAERPVDIRPPVARHYARQVDQRTMAKSTNSVVEPRIDVKADVEAIRTGCARIGRTPGGEVSYSVNGRTYGAHANGTLYPIEGDGIHVLDRGTFQALGVYNKFGNTSRAAEILDSMGAGANQRASALSVWKTYQ
jgi:hypothetical protein